VDHPPRVPVLKVCYVRYCARFPEIDLAFKLNAGILLIRCWVGLCINWNGLLLERLGYCSHQKTVKGGGVGVIVKEVAEL